MSKLLKVLPDEPAQACCGGATAPTPCTGAETPRFVDGTVATPAGPVPRVSSRLSRADRLGALAVRWSIGRGSYTVVPGLYALGAPTPDSPVLVSANYKLSFDVLRSSLPGLDAWILVLDTHGINVWCAAGKGTFGTDELARRVEASRLGEVVKHRRLVVPQLGAPGVAGFEVKRRAGFGVTFGPVRAGDLPAFLARGFRAEPAERRVDFPLADRARLIPVELVGAVKLAFVVGAALALFAGLGRDGYALSRLLAVGLPTLVTVVAATAGAAVLTPLLLPWLPGRAFAVKGLALGVVFAALFLASAASRPALWSSLPTLAAFALFLPAEASFIALNFTGASTYTSLSGVIVEMRRSIPVHIGAAALALALFVVGRFV
jgi:acetyl-CoA decarbonylase/synthase complex subunit gamma